MSDPGLEYAKQRDAERLANESAAARQHEAATVLRQCARPDVVLPEQKYAWWQNSKARENHLLKKLQRERVLGSISNPRVRELVEAAHAAANRHQRVIVRWIRSGPDYLDRAQGVTGDARTYRGWVVTQLAQSDLARLLPGGRENLPDIYEAMGEPWRSFERLFEPRSYKQLLAHVSRHLDWYLDPTQKPKPPIWQVSIGLAVVVLAALMGVLNHYGVRTTGGYLWYMVGKGLAAAFAALGARYWGSHKVGNAKLTGFYRVRGLINSTELYYYLAETYADVEEDAKPDEGGGTATK